MRHAHNTLSKNLKGKSSIEDFEANWRIILKRLGLCRVEWTYLTQDMNQQGFFRIKQHIFWFHNSKELLEQVSDFLTRTPLHIVIC
jgi:hypothetical protein